MRPEVRKRAAAVRRVRPYVFHFHDYAVHRREMIRAPAMVLAALALLAHPATGRAAEDDAQVWLSATAGADLGKRLRVSEELIARFSDDRDGLYEIENNLLLGYRFGRQVTAWAGYTHAPQYSGGRFTRLERRLREQVTIDDFVRLGPGSLSLRMRAEQRWREGLAGTAWRVRPYVRYTLPVAPGSKTQLLLSHESFINLDRTSFQTRRGEDRMRNVIALRRPLIKHVSGEIGYLNQYGFVRGGPDRIDHTLSITLILSP